MNEITWTLNLKVKDGPTFAPTSTMKVEAYDKVDIEVGVGKTETVSIQPGTRDEIQFLMLIRTDPKVDPPLEGTVEYKVSGSSGTSGSGSTSGGGTPTTPPAAKAPNYSAATDDESAQTTSSPAQTARESTPSTTGTQSNSGGDWITLDYVHVVLGKGALLLLKDEPQEITFRNNQSRAAQITVLVGRTATRETPQAGTEGMRGPLP